MKTTLSIEQSARLIELGVDPKCSTVIHIKGRNSPKGHPPTLFNIVDLLSILPKKIKCGSTSFRLRIGVDVSDNYWVKYVTTPWGVDPLESCQKAEELCDAIYAEICWLKEKPELVWL